MYILCTLHSFSKMVVSEAKTASIGTTWAWAGTCQETQPEPPLLNLQKDTAHCCMEKPIPLNLPFEHLNIKHLWGSTCSNDWVTTTPVIAEFPSSSRSSVSLKVGIWWNGIWLLEHTRCWQTSNEATNGGFVEFVDFGKHAILAHCKGPACWARTFLNFHRSRATSAMGYMTLMSSAPRIIVIVVCRMSLYVVILPYPKSKSIWASSNFAQNSKNTASQLSCFWRKVTQRKRLQQPGSQHKPMKSPNSRSGINTLMRFTRKLPQLSQAPKASKGNNDDMTGIDRTQKHWIRLTRLRKKLQKPGSFSLASIQPPNICNWL